MELFHLIDKISHRVHRDLELADAYVLNSKNVLHMPIKHKELKVTGYNPQLLNVGFPVANISTRAKCEHSTVLF